MADPASGNYRAYAGIGSRATPEPILDLMRACAIRFKQEGWTLRSGGAPGADTAFEGGATIFGDYSRVEIYLPWGGFEQRLDALVARTHPQRQAYIIAKQHHPTWERLTEGGRNLQARNAHQILGYDVTRPVLSKFVLCWTPKRGGGTGTALRIAAAYNVPAWDLATSEARERIEAMLARPPGPR